MSDSKKPDLVLSQLDTNPVGPYVVALSNNKRITFPDPGEMNAFEVDDFIQQIGSAANATEFFTRWLSEEDFEKLRAEKGFNAYRLRALMDKIGAHYKAVLGNEGEGTAS